MKKILLIGNGAREHVIADTLKKSPQGCMLYGYGKAVNPGIKRLCEDYRVGPLDEFSELVDFVKEIMGADMNEGQIAFAVVGPDNPIADGCADTLLELGIKSMAPLQELAQLESSKSFARDLLKKYEIPGNPKFRVFTDSIDMKEFMERELHGHYVVKADGLMGGKGVKLSGEHLETIEDGIAYAMECIEASGRVVIEEKFVGQEFSLMSFVDGTHVVDMPAIQDHKRAYEGDTGPNTGGMGTWSDTNHSLPFLNETDVEDAHAITVRVAEALKKETGKPFTGIMYGGFIAVKEGVRLIEYNARFGDPEAMNALCLLKSDFIMICEAIIQGRLHEVEVEFENKATVLKYVVPEGYPINSAKGEKIIVGDVPDGVQLFYSSVDERSDGLYLSGSRAIAFIAKADTIAEAEELAQNAVGSVSGPVFFRTDIGTEALIQVRLDHMKEVRV